MKRQILFLALLVTAPLVAQRGDTAAPVLTALEQTKLELLTTKAQLAQATADLRACPAGR